MTLREHSRKFKVKNVRDLRCSYSAFPINIYIYIYTHTYISNALRKLVRIVDLVCKFQIGLNINFHLNVNNCAGNFYALNAKK